MARIRTIKPEFWTDETIVKLPFLARLLFIGMWNFADDQGGVEYSPERLKLQILPAEQECDISGLIDLLEASGLISYWVSDEGTQAISIRNWGKHQKIDNPSKKTFIREGYRKKAIPSEERIAIAKKYGCLPGAEVSASCFYCGMPGKVTWWSGSNGKPTRWITLSDLEFDHFVSEHSGGDSSNKNIVLACRSCNRGKREFDPHQFFAEKNFSGALDKNIETTPLEGKGKEGKGKEGIQNSNVSTLEKSEIEEIFEFWKKTHNHPRSKLDEKTKKIIKSRLKEGYSKERIFQAIENIRNSPHHMGKNDTGTVYDSLELICRSGANIDRFADISIATGPPEGFERYERVLL